MKEEKPDTVTEGLTDEEISLVPPYRVILHNDDVTPMDFVVEALARFFISDRGKAREIMAAAHKEGLALVGIMPLETAEFKVGRAHDFSRAHTYPLTFSIEACE